MSDPKGPKFDHSLKTALLQVIALHERFGGGISIWFESVAENLAANAIDDTAYVGLEEQRELASSGAIQKQREIEKKTLIKGLAYETRTKFIDEAIASELRWRQSRTTKSLELVEDDLTVKFGFAGKSGQELDAAYKAAESNNADGLELEVLNAYLAAKEGKTWRQYKCEETREKYFSPLVPVSADGKIEYESNLAPSVAKFLVSQIPQVANAIERLDETDYKSILPEHLSQPFRELHINSTLGNYGTAVILCGSVLEQALHDLLAIDLGKYSGRSKISLNDLIEAAKGEGLLRGHALRFAGKIQCARNDIVHGKMRFNEVTSDKAWELISATRDLLKGLYAEPYRKRL